MVGGRREWKIPLTSRRDRQQDHTDQSKPKRDMFCLLVLSTQR
jgi:hypothetical protein